MMKKFLVCVLVSAIAGGAAFADPIGLTVYLDGFSFGNVAGEDYKFAGEDGEAGFTVGAEYAKSFGAVEVSTALDFTLGFSDPLASELAWNVKGAYELGLTDALSLTFSLFNTLSLTGGPDEAGGDSTKGTFADADNDQITDEIAPGIRFDQKLGFGTLYEIVEVGFYIHTQENRKLDIGSSSGEGFKIGVEDTGLGVYGYIQPELLFMYDGESPDDVLGAFNIGAGYAAGPLDVSVEFGIPTVKDGMKTGGLTITPNVTYSIIEDAFSAYLELEFSGIGADKDVGGEFGFSPTIGLSYSF
ncbi:MAG: hypothetical protein LBQ88_15140 [Treponema sp.]|jgi:hypothetical protein|nr:hypothetical protein [Treponema sp.]